MRSCGITPLLTHVSPGRSAQCWSSVQTPSPLRGSPRASWRVRPSARLFRRTRVFLCTPAPPAAYPKDAPSCPWLNPFLYQADPDRLRVPCGTVFLLLSSSRRGLFAPSCVLEAVQSPVAALPLGSGALRLLLDGAQICACNLRSAGPVQVCETPQAGR